MAARSCPILWLQRKVAKLAELFYRGSLLRNNNTAIKPQTFTSSYQKCTESEIFDSDSAPAEYTSTPTHIKIFDSDSFSNPKVNYLNFRSA